MPTGVYIRRFPNFNKGKKLSDATRIKISLALKGKMPVFIPSTKGIKFTEEHKHKLSIAHLGQTAWNKKQSDVQCDYCEVIYHKKPSHITKRNFCKRLCFDNWRRELDIETKERLKLMGRLRDRGLTQGREKIKASAEYKEWRRKVFERDNYTCKCGQHGYELHAHHIFGFAEFPNLRFDVNNGETLCEQCHKKTDNYGKNLKRG